MQVSRHTEDRQAEITGTNNGILSLFCTDFTLPWLMKYEWYSNFTRDVHSLYRQGASGHGHKLKIQFVVPMKLQWLLEIMCVYWTIGECILFYSFGLLSLYTILHFLSQLQKRENTVCMRKYRNTQRHKMVKENHMEGLLSYTITSDKHLI